MQANQQLIERIARAFPARKIDGRGAFDDAGRTYPDAKAYASRIHNKSWREADALWLVKRSDALGFLGTRSLVDVLPVYLVSAVQNGVWSPATEMLVLILAKPGANDRGLGEQRFAALVDALTTDQRVVVTDVLDHIAAIDPEGSLGLAARLALESYWIAAT